MVVTIVITGIVSKVKMQEKQTQAIVFAVTNRFVIIIPPFKMWDCV